MTQFQSDYIDESWLAAQDDEAVRFNRANGVDDNREGDEWNQPRERCGAYKEHWNELDRPEGWNGCPLPTGHSGAHGSGESFRRGPEPPAQPQYGPEGCKWHECELVGCDPLFDRHHEQVACTCGKHPKYGPEEEVYCLECVRPLVARPLRPGSNIMHGCNCPLL